MAEITERENLIFKIAKLEWEMFQTVYNTNGRASCQDDPDTFFRMRMSQWMVYSDEVLDSFLEDCEIAMKNGRNLIFEKYARMMQTTYPVEYQELKDYLPDLDENSREQINEIVCIHLQWDQEMNREYPNIRKNGRAMTTDQDSIQNGSSMESYLRAELSSVSPKTLALLLVETKRANENGDNLLKQIITNETAFYGFASLEEAESQK